MDLTKNEKCLIEILKNAGKGLTTKEVLTDSKKYPELCIGCSSGSHVIAAGIELSKKAVLTKKFSKGGYVWTLK